MDDPDDLRQYYDALSDEALLAIDPADLTDIARQYYDVELSHRGLKRIVAPTLEQPEPENPELFFPRSQYFTDSASWQGAAVPASEFEYVEDAERARDALEQAGILCAIVSRELKSSSLGYRYRGTPMTLMVPSSSLEAARERLRTAIDEPSAEQDYANHFVEFSDDELLDVDVPSLPESARKWHQAELRRRALRLTAVSTIPAPEVNARSDGFMVVANLPQAEAAAANRLLERASIPCRVEPGASQGGFETFNVWVPAASFDQASDILSQRQSEILTQKPAEDRA